jgi:hypothetical protein
MQNLSNEQKAQVYNKLLFQYQRLAEKVRLIRAESIDVTPENQRKINMIESEMKKVYNETNRLF